LNSPAPSGKTRLIRIAKLVFRLLVLTLVGIGIWQTVRKAVGDLHVQQFSWRQLQWDWVAASGVAYLAATGPCWVFWHRTLQAMGQRPGWLESLRAYYIGHLGDVVLIVTVVSRSTTSRVLDMPPVHLGFNGGLFAVRRLRMAPRHIAPNTWCLARWRLYLSQCQVRFAQGDRIKCGWSHENCYDVQAT